MPTGYTAAVQDGTITEFPDFAMVCARAFGALIMMRDESNDAQIPDEFQPSDYHQKALDAAKAELVSYDEMTLIECDKAAEVSFNEQVARRENRQAERLAQMARYTAMRSKAEEWTPPTPDHTGLREFMLEQLDSSIRFDCGAYDELIPVLQTGAEWLSDRMERAMRNVRYHTEKHAEELERTATRNAWVKALRNSLTIDATK